MSTAAGGRYSILTYARFRIWPIGVVKRQGRVRDIAHRFDQEPNGPCFPVNHVDRLAPLLGRDIRGVTRFHAQSCDRARWRGHDRPFDRV
jgi:hypothetical protein